MKEGSPGPSGLQRPPVRRALFDGLQPQPPDGLLGLIALLKADPRPDRIDLGVGVFRDDAGATPVMRAVKAAEAELLATQATKSYLGAEGDAGYTRLLADLVFGPGPAASGRLAGVQTPGGTGALRLGAELAARARPGARLWVGMPTWPNHAPIFAGAGLDIRPHPFFDVARQAVDVDAMMGALSAAQPGDLLLVHGCCHNPTGATLSVEAWNALLGVVLDRGLIPFVDLAYQGLGDGLEADAAVTRRIVGTVPEALVAYSCDKNFGLYRERVGVLWTLSGSAAAARVTLGNILMLARALWSMPPDHGAAIVRTILERDALRADWQAELAAMRDRINGLRRALAAAHPRLAPIAAQRGMFALLPIGAAEVARMREAHGIYMAPDGRMNIAGLRADTVARFAAVLAPYL